MSATSYVKNFFWLAGIVASTYQVTLIENSSSAFPPLSSSNPAVTPSFTKTQSTSSIPQPTFNSILPVLKTKTSLPIRLPAYIPEANGAIPVYALLETTTRSQYRILLAFSKNCTGGNACRLGSFFAQAITPKSPALTGRAVSLAQGMTGYFTDATCGANCSDATLVWEQERVRYSVAIKAGKVATLVKIANSALALGPVSREKARASMAKPISLRQNFSPVPKSMTISTAGIGRAKLGMTFGQLKRTLEPNTEFRVESPFLVDFDAISVRQSGKVQYYILYPAGTTLADPDKIQALLTDNPNFRTAEGVGAGMPLKQAEAVYGDATLFYNTANESREYVKFAAPLPQRSIHFRPAAAGQRFAGIYSATGREYNETKIYHSNAKIRWVEIVNLP